MAQDLKALERLFKEALREIPEKVMSIIEVETLAEVKQNFVQEGFDTGSGVDKWKKRTTIDKRGRHITRYRTNRVGRKGSPNKYGRSITGRALLVGHKTGGDKLRNSYKAHRGRNYVSFRTYKNYAQRHNEGLDGMPKRQHIGPSRALDRRYHKKLTRELDKLFRS